MIATAKNILNSLSQLFYPHICAGCGTDIIDEEQLLCLHCLGQLPITHFHMHANNPVEKIFWGRLPVTAAASYLHFTKDSLLQHLMHQFKYKGKKEIGFFFGREMGNAFLQSNRFKDIEALIPLPLFSHKEHKRGYNQATVICEGIAQIMGIPVLPHAINRCSATETQTRKNRIERWLNIEGKFELQDESAIRGKHILLVDDVITTGATLEACGHELLRSAEIKLSIGTLAYASS